MFETISGIYMIENKINNKKYIGQSLIKGQRSGGYYWEYA